MNILDEIITSKKEEIRIRKSGKTISVLEKSIHFSRPVFSLKTWLSDETKEGVIAEFKRRSPSKGIINGNADVIEVTRAYTEFGASALSVLTDEKYFGGCDADLIKARVNEIPILRKDFVIDEYQVLEARSLGADAILLIAACLSVADVKRLATFAKNAGLEVLLELHDETELEHMCEETEIIGINNRDLKTFGVNIERSLKMAESIPAGKIKVAESGIRSAEDILLFRENGYRGFLIGENFMKADDPGNEFRLFIDDLKNKKK